MADLKKYFLFILIFSKSLLSISQDEKMNADSLRNAYIVFLDKNDCDSALLCLKSWQYIQPNNSGIFFQAGIVYSSGECKNNDSAYRYYSLAVEKNDSIRDYFLGRAEFLWNWDYEKNRNQVIKDYEQVVRIDSFYYPAWEKIQTHYYYRNALYAAKIRKTVLRKMSENVNKDSTNALSWFWLGQARKDAILYSGSKMKKEDYIFCYTKSIELDSTYWKPYFERGVEYYGMGKYSLCISDMRKSLNLQSWSVIRSYIILSYQKLGDIKMVNEEADKALLIYPNDQQLLRIKKDINKK